MPERRSPPIRDDRVAEFMRESDGMPGERAALPPGSLPGVFDEPHGDENRDPPRLPTIPPSDPSGALPLGPQNRVTGQSPGKQPPSLPIDHLTNAEPESIMSSATTTTDHEFIRKWIEERGGRPSKVKGTEGGDGEGILRVDFREPDAKLEPISWEEFFETFEDRKLAFLHQDHQGKGTSRFFKFVRRDHGRDH